MERVECNITGRVQGVFFRDFVKQKADEHGLVGTVLNQPEGSVLMIAEGTKELLEKFVKELKSGSELANVHDISAQWKGATGKFDNFSIL